MEDCNTEWIDLLPSLKEYTIVVNLSKVKIEMLAPLSYIETDKIGFFIIIHSLLSRVYFVNHRTLK